MCLIIDFFPPHFGICICIKSRFNKKNHLWKKETAIANGNMPPLFRALTMIVAYLELTVFPLESFSIPGQCIPWWSISFFKKIYALSLIFRIKQIFGRLHYISYKNFVLLFSLFQFLETHLWYWIYIFSI